MAIRSWCLRHLGQIVVEHMGKLADINAAGSDIGGHQHPGLAGLEILQRGDAGSLELLLDVIRGSVER